MGRSKNNNGSWKQKRETKEERNVRLARQPLQGGLEDAVTTASPITIQSVPQADYEERRYQSWEEQLAVAYENGCSDYLTDDARAYYASTAPGRQPYYCYLRMDFIIRLSRARQRKLTLGEMELLVADDGKPNSAICVHQFQMRCKQEVTAINAARHQHRQAPIEPKNFRPSEDLITQCRFTPVRWVELQPDRLMWNKFFHQAEKQDDVLRLLACTGFWRYLGNYFDKVLENKSKKVLAVSGAPWRFNEHTGRYQTFPGSSLVMMSKTNPSSTENHASVGRNYVDEIFKDYLKQTKQADNRDLRVDAAEDVWSGNAMDLYEQILGAA